MNESHQQPDGTWSCRPYSARGRQDLTFLYLEAEIEEAPSAPARPDSRVRIHADGGGTLDAMDHRAGQRAQDSVSYGAPMSDESGTWHYGLIAQWWAEFNLPEPQELGYFRAAIRKFGEPVLDLGCGTGRILMPLLAEGFDVDGSDISADMIAMAQMQTTKHGFTPRLTVQPMHELDLPRMYRTIYICGAFGIGGRRDHDQETLRRVYRHLEPGGVLLITGHEFPYRQQNENSWARWLPGRQKGIEWPSEGVRRRTSEGDEIELLSRLAELDPLEQRLWLEMRARLWRGGQIVKEERYSLKTGLYFAQEVLLLLEGVGFRDHAIEGNYTGLPATSDDDTVIFVARK